MAFSTEAVDNSVDQTPNPGPKYGQHCTFVKLTIFYTIAIFIAISIPYKLQADYIEHNVTQVSLCIQSKFRLCITNIENTL